MTDVQRATPPPPQSEKPQAEKTKAEKPATKLIDIPGVFTVSIESIEVASPPTPPPMPGHYAPGGLVLVAVISAVLLVGLFLGLGRRKRRKA